MGEQQPHVDQLGSRHGQLHHRRVVLQESDADWSIRGRCRDGSRRTVEPDGPLGSGDLMDQAGRVTGAASEVDGQARSAGDRVAQERS